MEGRATEAEVLAFFEGFSVVENGVLLTTTPEGRSTGGGFVEFHSEAIWVDRSGK